MAALCTSTPTLQGRQSRKVRIDAINCDGGHTDVEAHFGRLMRQFFRSHLRSFFSFRSSLFPRVNCRSAVSPFTLNRYLFKASAVCACDGAVLVFTGAAAARSVRVDGASCAASARCPADRSGRRRLTPRHNQQPRSSAAQRSRAGGARGAEDRGERSLPD